MKKQLLNLSFVAVALALYVASAVAAPVAPVNTMEIPAAWPTPAIDGVAEDVYSDMNETGVFNPTGLEGDADFSYSFAVCWDPTYLYVYGEISDDVDESYAWSVGNSWEFDNVEFFLQLDTNTVTTSYGATTVQLRVCRNLDSVETAGRATRPDYEYYMDGAAAGGWLYEVAIPWTAVLATGAAPEDMNDYVANVIGFDISGADSDNTDGDAAVGNRDVQSAWDMDDPSDEADRTEDGAWNNTSVFGYVTLAPYEALQNVAETSMSAYPNPADNTITFDVNGTIEIYNVAGSLVLTSETSKVNLEGIDSGVYFAKSGNFVTKFVKR